MTLTLALAPALALTLILTSTIWQAKDEERRLLWPRQPNFRSVLAIGYKPTDSFRWHTDLAGEDGWVCLISRDSHMTPPPFSPQPNT